MSPEEFKAKRLAANHSQASLAKAMGLSVRQISRIECGGVPITKRTALALAQIKSSAGPKRKPPPPRT